MDEQTTYGKLFLVRDELQRKQDEEIKGLVTRILEERREHLEKYAAAFFSQVGPVAAVDYELVEQRSEDHMQIRWFFQRRNA